MALSYSFPGPTGLATTTDGRKAIAGLIVQDASGNTRAGIFPTHTNPLVTATATMNVDIAVFEGAAVQFGGAILFSNDGVAQLPSVLVSPGAGTNYYVVYAKINESTSPGTDANNNRVLGTVLSTSSFATARASGTRMDGSGTGLPTGAVELATVQMPTGKTATNQAGVTITPSFLYTAAAGGVVWVRNSTELAAWTPADGALAFQLDTLVHSRRVSGAWVPVVHAEAAGTVAAVVGQSAYVVTFPVGRFSQPPLVTVTPHAPSAGMGANITGKTASQMTVTFADGGGFVNNKSFEWTARQMTPASAAG